MFGPKLLSRVRLVKVREGVNKYLFLLLDNHPVTSKTITINVNKPDQNEETESLNSLSNRIDL